MYRSCIFCSADLGANEAIDEFPVGRGLAFDARRGRLWAVCPRCTRWNLAPIEERWEATESAEKLFRDSRLRVHSENVGLAKLPDGTRLIRVGEALPRELATWRYGDQLVRRRRQALLWGGAGVAATATVMLGGVALAGAAAAAPVFNLLVNGGSVLNAVRMIRSQSAVLHRVAAPPRGSAAEMRITAGHMQFARMIRDPEGDGVALRMPSFLPQERRVEAGVVRWVAPPPLLLRGEDARRLMEKSMARVNARGARPKQLDGAFARLDAAGDRDAFLRRLGEAEAGLFPLTLLNAPANSNKRPFGSAPDVRGAWRRFRGSFRGERLSGVAPLAPFRRIEAADALALEMVLHEQSERRALEGELATLEAAWREAEEIAGIADALPDDPLDRLRPREQA
jgi:hypothetical protein